VRSRTAANSAAGVQPTSPTTRSTPASPGGASDVEARKAGSVPSVARSVVGPVRRAPLRGWAEERAGLGRELLLQELELELEAGRGVVAARHRERGGQRREALVEAGELGVLEERHLAQALDVGLVLDLHHGTRMADQ